MVFDDPGDALRSLELPCGQCIGCREKRVAAWSLRCVYESQMHEHSVFVTLTYDDDHVPSDYSLNYRHFQLFMKRLRKRKGAVRFYMCGEYGEDFSRPHYHACLFGCFFDDREIFRTRSDGVKLYTSKVLSDLWPFGFSSVGDVTPESARYVAGYVMKKITGAAAEDHYRIVDGITGEIYQREPEFSRMSLRPGIAATWFAKYGAEVFPLDRCVVDGRQVRPPRYFDDIAVNVDWLDIEYKRYVKSLKCVDDSTPERLAVREVVAKARLATKSRSL